MIGNDLNKIRIVDKLFQALSIKELEELVHADLVVAKLKGIDAEKTGPIEVLVNDVVRLSSETMLLRSDLAIFKSDFQRLLGCLNRGIGDTSAASEFTILKNKYNAY